MVTLEIEYCAYFCAPKTHLKKDLMNVDGMNYGWKKKGGEAFLPWKGDIFVDKTKKCRINSYFFQFQKYELLHSPVSEQGLCWVSSTCSSRSMLYPSPPWSLSQEVGLCELHQLNLLSSRCQGLLSIGNPGGRLWLVGEWGEDINFPGSLPAVAMDWLHLPMEISALVRQPPPYS